MKYRIECSGQRYCTIANGREDLLKKIRELKDKGITDVRKVFKSGVSTSVLDTYQKHIEKSKQGSF